ncbi:hypothetical protein Tco_0826514 [Tanacetum coccineum]
MPCYSTLIKTKRCCQWPKKAIKRNESVLAHGLDHYEDEETTDVDIIPAEEVIGVEMIPDEELIDFDMTLDEGDAGGLDLEELFGLGLDDEDIMPNPVGPNINAQRQNTMQVLNKHRVYNIMNEGNLMSDDEE